MPSPRLYNGLDDLEKMQQLLRDGLRAFPYSYMHPGDIEWWIFYNPFGDQLSMHLWEDQAGNLMGFCVALKTHVESDLFIHPSLRGTAFEEEMVAWIEAFLTPSVNAEHPNVELGSIFANHASLQDVFKARGYQFEDYLAYFRQDLAGDLPMPLLPEGYRFLDKMNTLYADKRAAVHLDAFIKTSRMTPDYYRHFMTHAPMYRHDADVVVVAPDGQFAAFAMTWRDEFLLQGEFEPVGTRTQLQRQGLGRAVMLEGLQRMKAHGMKEATVCTGADQLDNIAFYEACGFERVNTVLHASKKIIA